MALEERELPHGARRGYDGVRGSSERERHATAGGCGLRGSGWSASSCGRRHQEVSGALVRRRIRRLSGAGAMTITTKLSGRQKNGSAKDKGPGTQDGAATRLITVRSGEPPFQASSRIARRLHD